MRSLTVRSLSIRTFRNLVDVEVELGARFNVLSGDNGQGKTNVLEALYILATSRSFRTSRLADLVTAGQRTASVRGVVLEADDVRQQSIGMGRGVRVARVDGKRPSTLAAYAILTPTVAFHGRAMDLASGGGRERRKLLDRLALFESPGCLADAEAYMKALRARQRVLESRGTGAPDLEDWEALMARHGSAVSLAREAVSARLGPEARRAFARIGPSAASLAVEYRRGSPESIDEFRAQLARNRSTDRARRSSSIGPQRDDLIFLLSGLPVRETASQGQQRALVLSLELAEIAIVGASRGVQPILLMDDVSSELDLRTTDALFGALQSARGQVLLTTTRRDLIDASACWGLEDRRDFRVVSGRIMPG